MNAETPIKKLFRVLRGPFVEAYGARLPTQSKAPCTSESPIKRRSETSAGSCEKCSAHVPQINLASSRIVETLKSAPTADSSREHAEEQEELWPTIGVTPAMLTSIEEIEKRKSNLASLQRRLRKANFRNINDEGRFETLKSDMNNGNKSNEADVEQKSTLERPEKAYQHSCDVKEMLASTIKSQEMNLKFAREELESEIRTLLLPLGILAKSDAGSEVSKDDFADTLDETQNRDNEDVEDDTDPEAVNERSPEEEALAEAAEIYKEVKKRLHSVQLKYDVRLGFVNDDFEMYTQAVEEERCDITRTEFDLEQLMQIQETTRELIEAEKAYSEIAWRLMDMGAIELTPSQTSRFVDQPEDEECLQNEAERALKATDVSRIERWKDRLDEANSSDIDGADEAWEIQTIGFGESCSVIAEGREAIRIGRWNRLRVEDWQVMLGEVVEKPETVVDFVFAGSYNPSKTRSGSATQSCTF